MAPKEVQLWCSKKNTTLFLFPTNLKFKNHANFSAGSREKNMFAKHEPGSNKHPWSCKHLANATVKPMKNPENTMIFPPTKRLRMDIHDLNICYPSANSFRLTANPPGKPNMLQRTKVFDAGFSVAGRDAVWNPKGFHNLSYVSAKCPQHVRDAFPKTLSLHWGRLSSHCVYSAVRRRLNSKNYWTQRLQSLWSSLISLGFCLFLSFSFSWHCFGKLSWSCFQDFQSAEVHM